MKHERSEHEKSSLLTTEQIVDHVREIMRNTGSVPPTVLVETQESGRVIAIPDFGDTAEERVQQMFEVGYAVGRLKELGRVLQVTLVTECWFSAGESAQKGIRPSEDPMRREGVLITSKRLQPYSTSFRLLEILRDDDGSYMTLLPLDTDGNDDMKIDGLLMDAFVYGYRIGSDRPDPHSSN